MTETSEIQCWPEKIRQRYENYLKTSFFFKDPALRVSFRNALNEEESLLKGPYPERARRFATGMEARSLARECFPDASEDLLPALIDGLLYAHQERAVRVTHIEGSNIVVATGTASGKTESFLYPILFELYRQHLVGDLEYPGVRALILYPMNALANDQRERLGTICENLRKASSGFEPTFGQYIGQTPKHAKDSWRNASGREEGRLPGELVFRDEMRQTPPHILLTNYSMLEYLLIRPDDSPLFDTGRGARWQFIVLDEAHQYRGAKGMEMGMLIRRLKQRLRDGGRLDPFRCIATSATLSSGDGEGDRRIVAEFAMELFGEAFSPTGIIFGEQMSDADSPPSRYHAFLRALEGAFLVHRDGSDAVVLNRKSEGGNGSIRRPLEIALCRECGQHYYVGRERNGRLEEAVRDPSHGDFGVDYYLPVETGSVLLCRRCGQFSRSTPDCDCGAAVPVTKCEPDSKHADQLKTCEACGYERGSTGDPVQEIVHGSDGPNAVIATALHELLPPGRRKVLAFADSRQEAAFFAWYAEDSYERLRDRNFILRAINSETVAEEGLSINNLQTRLLRQWEAAGLFGGADTQEDRKQRALTSILREALTDERRLSLSGVGLVKWFVAIPDDLILPESMQNAPWNLVRDEALRVIGYLLDEMRPRRAVGLPKGAGTPVWGDISPWPQQDYRIGSPGKQKHVRQWGGPQSAAVKHFLGRLLADTGLPDDRKRTLSMALMKDIWHALRSRVVEPAIFVPGSVNGACRLNPLWVRIKPAKPGEVWECRTCATLTTHNIRDICPRNGCPGTLQGIDSSRLHENHYRILYEVADLPPKLSAEEHTAQIDSDKARQRQDRFKSGNIHLLSSSTTFEVGVDLGDLEAVFLRNVPPEPFNYTQRVGRAGRRDRAGLALTYCRRNPHDLYHYEDPENRMVNGAVRPPRLRMTNEKIVLRHMTATALSAFFRENPERFESTQKFVGENWSNPRAVSDLKAFCKDNAELKHSLLQIVPEKMYERVGLENDVWIDNISGPESRFVYAEAEVCGDYREMKTLREQYFKEGRDRDIGRIGKRMKTIAEERTLNFLSRKAVIPKYGFPVDVVDLDTRFDDGDPAGVALQRDLSQAIAEYAPGGKVVANKREWESCGVKSVAGKEWPVRYYRYDDARNFHQWTEGQQSGPPAARKYLIPEFGFVTPLFKKPSKPRGRARRLYTTRPFFPGFGEDARPKTKTVLGVRLTEAAPGTLVILCEGRNRKGFFICRSCGAHTARRQAKHKSPSGSDCRGKLEWFSLGHELVTDVVRLQFPQLYGEWDAYSVAYAVLLGAAETLNVPDTDLNVTITGGDNSGESAIVLYDNVPGGAGLVAQLEEKRIFAQVVHSARERVQGNCGCDSSCYGCLRSYRNQFAHPHLDRERARQILTLQTEVG